jgi:hypothetical protein
MKKSNLWIDLGIFAAFLLAMEPQFTGVTIHEWLSLALAGTVLVHLLLHWKWIRGVLLTFFKKLWHTSRLKFVVDLLLFISFTAVMLSGVMISRAVLPALGIHLGENFAWRMLHNLSATLSLWLVAIHFALNWDMVVEMTRRYGIEPLAKRFRRPAQSAAVEPSPVEKAHQA